MGKRICNACKEDKELLLFYRDKTRKLGRAYECKLCAKARVTQYNKQPEVLEKMNLIDQTTERHKVRAKTVTRMRVRNGTIIRPGCCSKCKKKCKPEGHHPDYNKPKEIIWLCSECHKGIHNGR